MTDPVDENEDEARRKKKKGGDSGEGDADSWGRGKAGAGAGGIKITPLRLKAVMADWRHLDVTAVVQAVAEFFNDWPMRASANLSVAWKQTKTNAKSFALINWIIEFGEKMSKDLKLVRDKRSFKNQREQKVRPSMGMNMGPTGPTGQ
jgi:hypothetical protein